MWEKDNNINEVKEIRLKTTAYLGVGAINKINDICKEMKSDGIDSILILTGRSSFKRSGAWDPIEKALEENKIKYKLYSKVTPNPEVKHVNEAAAIGKEINAKAVMGIGGGSPIDTAKSVAVLLEYPEKTAEELYELTFEVKNAVPIIAVNLTHGTGTEVDRFAVVSIPEKEYKPAIALDCLYPKYAIDDPELMLTLSEYQTRYVTIDALNHIVEACTTTAANPVSILFAKETVRLIAKYLPIALNDSQDLESRYYLAYASMIAGSSFDNGLLHFTHALEHPLSAVKTDLTHGLGLAVLLPSVIQAIYDARGETLVDVLSPIIGEHKVEDLSADEIAKLVRNWLKEMGVKETLRDLDFSEENVDRLTELAFETPGLDGLLASAPVEANKEVVKSIYINAL